MSDVKERRFRALENLLKNESEKAKHAVAIHVVDACFLLSMSEDPDVAELFEIHEGQRTPWETLARDLREHGRGRFHREERASVYWLNTPDLRGQPKKLELPPDLSLQRDRYRKSEELARQAGHHEYDIKTAQSTSEICLLGTIGDVDIFESQEDERQELMTKTGAWASWWSFTIDDKAMELLKPPFFLYLNIGQANFAYRFEVSDFETSRGNRGIESPWPESTREEVRGIRKSGESKAEIHKTWLRVTNVEKLEPPFGLERFRPARGLSDERNLLNQNRFGYAKLVKDGEAAVSAPFTLEDAMKDLFISRGKIERILDLLRDKKNVILQGPPGVGKTFVARRLAYALMGVQDESRVKMVQFHQTYSYEDFIQGYRPAPGGAFERRDGVFYEFCRQAADDPEQVHVFIIDEINRGNLSRIFGELMMLIERDKRGSRHAIDLTYKEPGDERFYVPENLYLLGLMNTADRSLAMVDYALRRRFAFIDLEPAFESEVFKVHLLDLGASERMIARIRTAMRIINAKIEEDDDLGRGYCVGHSYFCSAAEGTQLDDDWYCKVIENEIGPLLREYWYEKPASHHAELIGSMLKG